METWFRTSQSLGGVEDGVYRVFNRPSRCPLGAPFVESRSTTSLSTDIPLLYGEHWNVVVC